MCYLEHFCWFQKLFFKSELKQLPSFGHLGLKHKSPWSPGQTRDTRGLQLSWWCFRSFAEGLEWGWAFRLLEWDLDHMLLFWEYQLIEGQLLCPHLEDLHFCKGRRLCLWRRFHSLCITHQSDIPRRDCILLLQACFHYWWLHRYSKWKFSQLLWICLHMPTSSAHSSAGQALWLKHRWLHRVLNS